MKKTQILLLASVILLTIGASSAIGQTAANPLGGGVISCSADSPCYYIAGRTGSAGLAFETAIVKAVYVNGHPLIRGTDAEYHVEMGDNNTQMVIVHMPPNTTKKPEIFQIVAER